MKKLLLLIAASAFAVSAVQGQTNLIAGALNNGDFDLDTVGAAPATWGLTFSGVVSNAYALSGTNSLAIDSTGAGAWSSPNAFQTFAVNPGDVVDFSGNMLMPLGAPITDASFGLLKVEFADSGANVLDVAGLVTVGAAAAGPFFGAESTPFINSGSAVDTWIFTQTVVTAPAGAVSAKFVLLNVNQGVAPSPIYFDDVVATVTPVPEPSTFALLGGLLALGFVMYRRRK